MQGTFAVSGIENSTEPEPGTDRTLAYVYGHADQRDAETAKGLTLDEARRIARNIAKLPTLFGKG